MGSEEYVSPEVLKDESPDFGSDIWALGCILFKMLYGKTPFKDINEPLTFNNIIELDYSFP